MTNRDLLFIGGKFASLDLPKEKKYLLKYFRPKIQQMFLRYVICFGDYINFNDHTGHFCQVRWLKMLDAKLKELEEIRRKAKANLDLETLAALEAGTLKIKNLV